MRREIAGLRIAGARGDIGGVWFEGPLEMGFAVCLHSRVAMRVLLELVRFPADDAEALYAGARSVDWKLWMTARTTLAVSADVSDVPALRHSGFAALKVKDAVVDSLRDALGARPDVNPRNPDVAIRLHVQKSEARLFLDLSGEPLHRRGYRVAMTDAPLKESLAAAVLLLGRVEPTLPFVDPMCGSGTLAIEHALLSRRIAPGLSRRFGFQRWPLAQSEDARRAWERLVAAARADVLPKAQAPIVCAERFPDAVESARKNADAAGVAGDLTFDVADVRDIGPQWPGGNLVTNPPYGERLMGQTAMADDPVPSRDPHPRAEAPRSSHGRSALGQRPPSSRPEALPLPMAPGPQSLRPDGQPAWDVATRDAHVQQLKLAGLYRGMSEAFEKFRGWGIVVLSGNPMWAQEMRRRPSISHRLFNGPLEVRLLRYDIPTDGSGAPPAAPTSLPRRQRR